jgi:hypothetical protein
MRLNLDDKFQVFTLAVIFAIILGLFVSVFFIVINRDSYSSIYIVPDSIVQPATHCSLCVWVNLLKP